MGNKKMSFGMLFTYVGALFAYLVGSGFASGQEILQYQSGWGSAWAAVFVGLFNMVILYLGYVAYSYVGRTRDCVDISAVYNFYAGKIGGKLFELFAWLFNTCCYVFMISGFGSTLNQQWGIPLYIGCGVAVVLSVITAVLGLTRIVDIIGRIGPFLVGFSLLVGIIAAFKFFPLIAEGNALVLSGEVKTITVGPNFVFAGFSLGGCSMLLTAAFVGRLGYTLRDYQFKYNKLIIAVAAVVYPLCTIILALDHIGNIKEAADAAVPNLLLANAIFGVGSSLLTGLFAIVILAGIYTTICPMLWTCVSMVIKDEKSVRYKLACAGTGIVVYFVCLFIPYQSLLNYIMTYCGYTGAIVFVVCVGRYYIIRTKDKKEKSGQLSETGINEGKGEV